MITPEMIQLIGGELAIVWNDRSETYITLDVLRRACPCASCGGEPDVLGNLVRPRVSYNHDSFELLEWKSVGGYALQPQWKDRHGTGIYSYEYLRRLGEAANPTN